MCSINLECVAQSLNVQQQLACQLEFKKQERQRWIVVDCNGDFRELSDAGEYCGYTPVDVDLRPLAGVPHEETLLRARDGVEERFRAWHGERPWRRGWW